MSRLLFVGIFLVGCIIAIQAKPATTRSFQDLVDEELGKSTKRGIHRVGEKLHLLNDAKQQLKLWNMYKSYFNQKYSSEEEEKRAQIFLDNLRFVTEHNDPLKQKKNSYKLALNKLSSMSAEEIRQHFTGLRLPSEEEVSKVPVFNASAKLNRKRLLAESLDYRSYMNPIENQGQCGSCYSFAATAVIEAAYAIKKGMNINLSKQEIVDCSPNTFGCHGGWFAPTCDYIMEQGGLHSAADYEYIFEAEAGTCRAVDAERTGSIESYGRVEPGDEEAMKIALAEYGPLWVTISVGNEVYYYESGVIDIDDCSKRTDHAVVIVGYGSEDGQDYWLIRNSWGEDYGDSGYFRMARNKGDMCGISQYVFYPIV
jgi:C1A family cysteine protease